jgi:hypothetical protein
VKHVIVWTRIGTAVLAAIAVFTVAQKIDSESKAWQGSIGDAPLDARHATALGTNQTAVTPDPHALHKSDQISSAGAVRTRWVLQDSRVSLAADDLYISEDDLASARALPDRPADQSIHRTSARGTIVAGSSSDVEASGVEEADSAAPNVAQSEALDPAGALDMDKTFANEVQRRLNVPTAAQLLYGSKLQQALQEKSLGAIANEYVVLVDRNQNVQVLFIYFRAKADGMWHMVGATPVSTGLPGTYDHFTTPIGIFEHTPRNMDFRSEGTLNEFKIRGYGARDMRIYDFGWAQGARGWGKGGMSQMRFQMHATDPDKLEPVLGARHSKGCVRIPAALNVFFDHHGILDADYEARVAAGESLWILKPRRDSTPWAGHYLVVIDSAQKARPAWSPLPDGKARSQFPAHGNSAD